ncbi:hypothetical protein VTJ49DRAFT_4823 [Mycothermus thermophilus]|uniref:Nuclear pore complex component n=1 Tax=Humicola insolens TaxID=85995 RepID=A0ABR3V4G5_HUMIN
MSSSLTHIKSTPVKQTTPAAVTESPGNWKHPRLAEITRRQSKNTFSEKNARQIVYNVAALAVVGVVRQVVLPALPTWAIAPILRQHSAWIYTTIILIPLINIAIALLPLIRPRDDLSDIPLTPAQRKLLGLPPSSRAATPAPDSPAAYNTPPRYSRTPSLAGSPAAASIKSYTSSPISTLGSPLAGANGHGHGSGQRYSSSPRFGAGTSPSKLTAATTFSPQQYSPSPSAISPLRHKIVSASDRAGGPSTSSSAASVFGVSTSSSSAFAASTSSFASSTTSPLGASTMSSVFGDGPATPTPTGKRSSVGLNSKWLYEKGRRGSGSGWLHAGLS